MSELKRKLEDSVKALTKVVKSAQEVKKEIQEERKYKVTK
jgi:hypothetical protein